MSCENEKHTCTRGYASAGKGIIFNTPKQAFDELRPGFEGATKWISTIGLPRGNEETLGGNTT